MDNLKSFEPLTDDDREWVLNQVRLAEDKPGFPWIGLIIAGVSIFWVTLGLILLT